MILHGYSGGAFYLEAMANGAHIAHQHLTPNLYIGSSSGALLAVVAAIRGSDDMLKIARKIDPTKAFKNLPFNKKGNPTLKTIWRLIWGNSPASQDARPILRAIIPKSTYLNYLSSKLTPTVHILTADVEYGRRVLWDIKKDCESYREFIDVWEASTRMQGMTEPIEIRGRLYWDGGQFDHNPTHLLIDGSISKVVSLWSRPKDWTPKQENLKNTHYLSKLLRMIDIDNIEKSRNDEEREVALCEEFGVDRYPIYTKRTLINPYDTDRGRLNMAIQSTIKSAKDAFN